MYNENLFSIPGMINISGNDIINSKIQAEMTKKKNKTPKGVLDLMNKNINSSEELNNALIVYGKKNIKYLSLYGNVKLLNLWPLEETDNLIELDLRRIHNDFSDLSFLKNKNKLKRLYFSSSNIGRRGNTDYLKKLINLEILDIPMSFLRNIDFLENMKKLKKLNLSDNLVSDISVLENLNNLEELNLSGCKNIFNPEILLNLKNLKKLNIDGIDIPGNLKKQLLK